MSKNKIYGLMDLITKLMVINFIWFLTLIGGMVAFTVFPATAALFITVRKLLEDSISYSEITKYYLNAFGKNFFKFTIIGVVSVIFTLILISNFLFIFNYNNLLIIKMVLQPIMIFIGLCGSIVFVNLFIINTYEELKVDKLFKTSLYNLIRIPFNGLIRFILFIAICIVLVMFPGLLPVISVNVLAVLSIWIYPKPFIKST